MFHGKMKAVTFSYDDGVKQDRRLVEMLNRYGLKATFNLNSALLGKQGKVEIEGMPIRHDKITAAEVRSVYAGHEIAVHTLNHPNLTTLPEKEIIRQVEEDRKALGQLAGYEVIGMAYPCGGVNHDDRVAGIIQNKTGVRFARTITSTYSFSHQLNRYKFHPTVHHMEWDKLFSLGQQFLDLNPGEPQLFYIWGHSYELDYGEAWKKFEGFCRFISGYRDIFYGTNREVLDL